MKTKSRVLAVKHFDHWQPSPTVERMQGRLATVFARDARDAANVQDYNLSEFLKIKEDIRVNGADYSPPMIREMEKTANKHLSIFNVAVGAQQAAPKLAELANKDKDNPVEFNGYQKAYCAELAIQTNLATGKRLSTRAQNRLFYDFLQREDLQAAIVENKAPLSASDLARKDLMLNQIIKAPKPIAHAVVKDN